MKTIFASIWGAIAVLAAAGRAGAASEAGRHPAAADLRILGIPEDAMRSVRI